MKKILKGALAGGMLFLLAGCRNQVNRDFLNRFVELQETSQTTSTVKLTDIGFADGGMGLMSSYLEAILAELNYEMTLQKDTEDPTVMSLELGIHAMGSTTPFMEGFIAEEEFLLETEPFFNLQLLTGTITQEQEAAEQLFADYSGKYVAIESEEADAEAADLMEGLAALRKGFLDLDPELFTETDEAISVTLGKAELETLFTPLLTPPGEVPPTNALGDLWGEDAVADVTLTVGKDTDTFAADLLFDQVDFNQLNKLGLEMDMAFADNETEVSVPAEEDVVPLANVQNLLTPIHSEFSTTGYTDAIFQEVLERVENERENLNQEEGQVLLRPYQRLLTEEQYRELTDVMDLANLPTRYQIPENSADPNVPHSDLGMGEQRFEALLDSVLAYRDSHTKESAQKTLDQYRGQLTEEQYKQLEEALDIETLPE